MATDSPSPSIKTRSEVEYDDSSGTNTAGKPRAASSRVAAGSTRTSRRQDRSSEQGARMGKPHYRGAYRTRGGRERNRKMQRGRDDPSEDDGSFRYQPVATKDHGRELEPQEEKSYYGGDRGQAAPARTMADREHSARNDRSTRRARGKDAAAKSRKSDGAAAESHPSPADPNDIQRLCEIVDEMRVQVEGQHHSSDSRHSKGRIQHSDRGKKHERNEGSRSRGAKQFVHERHTRAEVSEELASTDPSETSVAVSRGREVASAPAGRGHERHRHPRRDGYHGRGLKYEGEDHGEGKRREQSEALYEEHFSRYSRQLTELEKDERGSYHQKTVTGGGEHSAGRDKVIHHKEQHPGYKVFDRHPDRPADSRRELKGRDDFDSRDHERQSFSRGSGKSSWRTRQEPMKVGTARADELVDQLVAGSCECMVCCDVVRREQRVWSCSKCYHIFHLRCIQQWARSEAAQVQVDHAAESSCGVPSSPGWRCPGCQNLSDQIPNSYMCFCGNVDLSTIRRRPRDYGVTPHSCGEICNKHREAQHCTHRCNILCHPGPCPPCPVMLQKSCGCGRTTVTLRCSQASAPPSCGKTCDRLLACGRHRCVSTCHGGMCDRCEERIDQVCFCGREKKELQCGSLPSRLDAGIHQGAFSCGALCGKLLPCGNHLCERPCHAGPCGVCERRPEAVHSCHCGQMSIEELLENGVKDALRQSCLDPIPSCGQLCNRPLSCGQVEEGFPHRCHAICHDGPCRPCPSKTKKKCRCGRTIKKVPCRDICNGQEILCDTLCNKKRTCGRHRCSQRCCADKEHTCMLVCGKKLQCGYHKCEELCHPGHCGQCWQTGFDELRCHCGAEVILPPIACGTKPPSCSRPCSRPHTCEHPPQHTCHTEETCPPCTVLTTKPCMGGHELRGSIPCHITDVSCGQVCGKQMPCGVHNCTKVCHKGGCLPEGSSCQQLCAEPREGCPHSCAAPCHVGSPCPNTLCRAKVLVKCPCGRRTEEVLCYQVNGKTPALHSLSSSDLARKMMGLQSGQPVDLISRAAKQLECDETCAVEERNRRMAEALQLDGVPVSADVPRVLYSSYLIEKARTEPALVANVEDKLITLVKATMKMPPNSHKSYMFPVMGREQRRLIHELAEHYACETQSIDPEPQRSVIVTATSKSFPPPVSLTNFIKFHLRQPKPLGPVLHLEQNPPQKTLQPLSTGQPSTKIDYFDTFDD